MATIYKHTKGEQIITGDDHAETGAFTSDMYGKDIERCSFCGSEYASGLWRGDNVKPITCCRECARNVLPCLMADVLVGETPDASNGAHRLHATFVEHINGVFWRAVALALERAYQTEKRRKGKDDFFESLGKRKRS